MTSKNINAFNQPMPGNIMKLNSDVLPTSQHETDVGRLFRQKAGDDFNFRDVARQRHLLTFPSIHKKIPTTAEQKKKKQKQLTSREIRRLRVFQLKSEGQRYSHYISLHKLWCSYIKDLVDLTKVTDANISEFERKMTRADFHGAVISVNKSRSSCLVGLKGIVLQETKNTFKIITEKDLIRTIPKPHSEFCINVEDYVVVVYGNNICHKPPVRTTRKFKQQASIDI
ncbi:hypothetical protein CAPTEDRAFT_156834 [Capitella teleta]|uniref:Ribonuclease P protein subunit p29 n=1 Tax=Capitella teleta TaxID=283909 RepID=R7TNS2_CAPTE|nr:hypothetical protein CAPTEDRAFT_156834 [Capitella teleta]|eukprot:ELT93186.1 hypothetical protein CAPTEDRAFT_156834 [Capitella teleta]